MALAMFSEEIKVMFSLLYIRRKSVVNIVVLEGPSVQNIYQQVIRDFPGLVGAGWESRRRQV